MSKLAEAVRAAKYAAGLSAMGRYEGAAGRLLMMKECFLTFDPKSHGQKTLKPWLMMPEHEEIATAVMSGEWFEVDNHKSKQAFFTWTWAGIAASGMMTDDGFRGYVQSRKEDVAVDVVDRVQYILTHLAGSLNGLLRTEDWTRKGNVLELHSFLGREMRSDFTALPDGPEQWRYLAASMGIMDEAAFPREARQSYAAALSACEGGGVLVVNSTADEGSWFNEHIISGLKEAEKERVRTASGE